MPTEDVTLAQALAQWFTQGGAAQFGALDNPQNADELIAQILERVRSPREGERPYEEQCEEGVTVRWCPRCGTCTCPYPQTDPDGWTVTPGCPIHDDRSTHAEPKEA